MHAPELVSIVVQPRRASAPRSSGSSFPRSASETRMAAAHSAQGMAQALDLDMKVVVLDVIREAIPGQTCFEMLSLVHPIEHLGSIT